MNLNTIDNNIDIRDRDNNWWGKLPIGWRVKKLKYISLIQLSNVDKLSVEGQEIVFLCNYTDVYKNEKIVSTLPFMQATATDEQIKRLSIQKSDVLLTKDSETPDDIGIPAIVAEEMTGVVCGYHLALSRPNPDMVHSGFLFRVIQSQPIKRYFFVNSVGMTRYGLDKQAIAETPIPLPSLSIQKAIAEYLDHEIAYIDALIDSKRLLLELLAEKRKALIFYAVTRGINPNAPLHNTGIAWLGDIPTHWEIKKLKYIAEVSYGVNDELDKSLTTGIPLISLPNISIEGRLDLTDHGWTNISNDDKLRLLLRKGDLLFNWRNGSSQHLGKTAYFDLEGEYTHVGFLLRIRFNLTNTNPQYFHYFLNTLRINGFFAHAKAMVNNTFNQSELENLDFLIPPEDEQQEIVDYLDCEINKIDRLSQATQSSIALLIERRAAIISAAVSGQLGSLYEETK